MTPVTLIGRILFGHFTVKIINILVYDNPVLIMQSFCRTYLIGDIYVAAAAVSAVKIVILTSAENRNLFTGKGKGVFIFEHNNTLGCELTQICLCTFGNIVRLLCPLSLFLRKSAFKNADCFADNFVKNICHRITPVII